MGFSDLGRDHDRKLDKVLSICRGLLKTQQRQMPFSNEPAFHSLGISYHEMVLAWPQEGPSASGHAST